MTRVNESLPDILCALGLCALGRLRRAGARRPFESGVAHEGPGAAPPQWRRRG